MVWCVAYGRNHEVVDKLETGEAKGPSKPITNVSACRGAAGGSKATSDIL